MLRVEDCKPGVMVECIASPSGYLNIGGLYTIEVLAAPYQVLGGVWCVSLQEKSGHDDDGLRWCWPIKNFRLLPDSRLAIFRAMLAPKPMVDA